MWYAIMRHPATNKVMDFIVDEDEMPMEWETEEQANEALKGHAYSIWIDVIEID